MALRLPPVAHLQYARRIRWNRSSILVGISRGHCATPTPTNYGDAEKLDELSTIYREASEHAILPFCIRASSRAMPDARPTWRESKSSR